MAQQRTQNRLIELGVAQVNMNARDLGLAMASLAQDQARNRLYVASTAVAVDDGAAGVELSTPTITALTDNTTGTGATSLVAVPVGVAAAHGASAPTKASFDTQMGLVEDAHQELVDQINLMIGAVAGSTARAASDTEGADGDGTLAEIAAFSNSADDSVDLVTGNAQIVIARNNQAALAAALNYIRVAVGVAPFTDSTGGNFAVSATEYVLVDAAATGDAIDTEGQITMSAASALASLNALKNNISSMCDLSDELIGELAIGPFVVATNNPRTRFTLADTTL